MAGARGIRRLAVVVGLLGLAFLLGACEPDGVTVTVTVSADGRDASPGDGVCEVTVGVGDCSLRAAIDETNVLPNHERIVIAPGVDPVLALGPAGDDANVRGDLDITDSVTIESAGGAVIDAAGLDRVFHIVGTPSDATWVNVRQVTVAGGAASQGAGAWLGADVTLNVERSTFRDNVASGTGGAFRVGSGGSLTVKNSTVSGNSAAAGAGGVFSLGSVNLIHATVADTSSTTAAVQRHASASGALTVQGSIVADQAVGADCSGVVTSSGGNLSSAASCGFTGAGDQQNTDPLLGVLADNGGPTETHLPVLASPAVNTIAPGIGQCGVLLVDQRGEARPNGIGCDKGSVEVDNGPSLALVVDAADDATDAAPGDGVCDRNAPPSVAGDCTLRAAISESNATITADTITIAAGVHPVLSIVGANEDANATGDLDVLDHVLIDGDGATVSAAGIDRVFHTDAGSVTLQDLTITGGVETGVGTSVSGPLGGGGIQHVDGTLTVDGTTISGNAAPNAYGGGLHQRGGTVELLGTTVLGNTAKLGGGILQAAGSLVLQQSTLTTNVADGGGGGLYQDQGDLQVRTSTVSGNQVLDGAGGGLRVSTSATVDRSTFTGNRVIGGYNSLGGALATYTAAVTINDSTFSGNVASGISPTAGPSGHGGALFLSQSTANLNRSTIAGNQSPNGAALAQALGTVTIRGSILAGNTQACWTTGTISSAGYNLGSDSSCSLIQPSDQPSTDPLVDLVADNGGPTLTRMPYANSAAVDAIPPGTASLCTASTPIDQRGVARPSAAGCDIGAVEGDNGITAQPLLLVVDTAADGNDAAPGDGVCDRNAPPSDPGDCSLRAAISETNVWPTADTIELGAGVHPVLSLAGAGEDANATGDLDIADNLVLDGNGQTVDADDLDRVFHVHTDGDAELRELVIADGTSSSGGGLQVERGSAALVGSTVRDNRASQAGGAIRVNGGALTITGSTISDNVAFGAGADGGGVYHAGGTLTVRLSTISGNTASDRGGGLWNGNSFTLSHVELTTIAGNTATFGSAFTRAGGNVLLSGSLLSGSGSGSVCFGAASSDSAGYNIAADASCNLTQPTDLPSTNALLGPLAANGGPTMTHLPGVGSPAIGSIPVGTVGLCDGTLTTDQRGVARPTGAACDRGAVEQ